jgi:hypothetical protein
MGMGAVAAMRRGRRLSALVLASCLAFSSADAHAIHTTMTAVTWRDNQVTLSVRTFADDFSASVAIFAGKTPPRDWAVSEADVARYMAARVQLRDARGALQPMQLCGVQRVRELYQLCVRVDGIRSLRGLQLENRLLVERHDDQVNIMQVDGSGTRKTLLFTRRTRSLPLAD